MFEYDKVKYMRNVEKKKWQEIADYYQRNRHTLSKWFKRETEKRLADTSEKNGQNISVPSSHASAVDSGYSAAANKRLGKYGTKPPTLFISDLTHDQWIVKYCGFTWFLDYLTELRQFLWEVFRGLGLLPRGHGKTISVICIFARWILEKRQPVLNITNGPAGSRRIFNAIKTILESDAVRKDYGDVYQSCNKTTFEIYLRQELRAHNSPDPDFKTAGLKGEFIGLHPEWIHYEDIIQQESKNEEIKEDLERFHEEVIEFCASSDSARITMTSTRKGLTDFNNYLMDQNYRVLHYKAIELVKGDYPNSNHFITEIVEDGGVTRQIITGIEEIGEYKTLQCPHYSLQRLLISRTRDLEAFESQMQNNPLPSSGLYFDANKWVETDIELRLIKSRFQACDPGYGETKQADNTAVIVIGIYNGKAIIIDGFMDKIDPFDDLPKILRDNVTKHNINQSYLETEFWQIMLKKQIQTSGLKISGVKSDKKNKLMRIDSLKPYFTEGLIEIHKDCPIKDKLKIEYLQYNQRDSTANRKDDGLDALEMVIRKTSYYVVSDKPYKVSVM